jgi:hypothetical protein
MKKNTLAWFVVAGASIAISGLGMAACSSSSATGTPGDDSTGNDSGNDSTTNNNDSGPGNDGGTTDAGADSSCGSVPTLHTTTNDAGMSDIFCESSASVEAYCVPDASTLNHCCINTGATPYPDGECTTGACTADYLDIQCNDDKGCAAGTVCCGLGSPYLYGACGYEKVYGFKGTQCAASCAALDTTDAGHFELCSKTQGCSNASATCTPSKEYIQFGVCKD